MLRSCSVNHRRLIIIVVSGVGFRCTAGDLRWRSKRVSNFCGGASPPNQIFALRERCVWKSESYSCNSVSALNSWTGRRVTGDVDWYPFFILTEDEFPADYRRVYEDERNWNDRLTNLKQICRGNSFYIQDSPTSLGIDQKCCCKQEAAYCVTVSKHF